VRVKNTQRSRRPSPPLPTATPSTVNDCVFDHNGAGDGQSHNIYIGEINTFVMTNSISEDAVVGHEVKSREQYNRRQPDNRRADRHR
jgi:hypothetical protein